MSESEYEGLLPDEEQDVLDTPGSVMEDMNRESRAEADEEIPPEPGEPGDLAVAPLAVREAASLAGMTPSQRERYDAANAELAANPTVAAFAQEEERARAQKKGMQEAFLAAYRKKKEKA